MWGLPAFNTNTTHGHPTQGGHTSLTARTTSSVSKQANATQDQQPIYVSGVVKGVDEPSAVIRLDLQGFKDLHKAVGRVLALLEE